MFSMTAFARVNESTKEADLTWEIRSVNHRYLDISLKIPDEFRALENNIREQIRAKVSRGRLECYLQYRPKTETSESLKVNIKLVQNLTAAIEKIKPFLSQNYQINPLEILNWEGVLEIPELEISTLTPKIFSLLDQALEELVATRKREGEILEKTILEKLLKINSFTSKIKKLVPHANSLHREKLLARLAEIKHELDHQRLEQEMVFFTQKVDVAEELDRLDAHYQEMSRVIKQECSIGKRLEFLLQEMGRETNTLSAKSPVLEITNHALEIKVLLEQIREQTQNIE
jgi:uncharacterized protein (TIGR00255 family)